MATEMKPTLASFASSLPVSGLRMRKLLASAQTVLMSGVRECRAQERQTDTSPQLVSTLYSPQIALEGLPKGREPSSQTPPPLHKTSHRVPQV